jgi:hypothetical protein
MFIGACIELFDPTHGTACAKAVDGIYGCMTIACNSCPAADFQDCESAAMMGLGPCASYSEDVSSACLPDLRDGGPFDTCNPSEEGPDPDYEYIISLICGGAGTEAGAD